MATQPDGPDVFVESGCNPEGKPFVITRLGTASAQLSVAQARAIGGWFWEAAEAAEGDAAMFKWAQKELGATVEEVAVILQGIRAARRGVMGDEARRRIAEGVDSIADSILPVEREAPRG